VNSSDAIPEQICEMHMENIFECRFALHRKKEDSASLCLGGTFLPGLAALPSAKAGRNFRVRLPGLGRAFVRPSRLSISS
jgi:hypothetical protein